MAGVVHGLAQPSRRRSALRWARAQGGGLRARLALAVLAHYGRVVADGALVGMAGPEALRRHVRIEGEQHLTEATRRGGTIILGFHLGLPSGWLGLRVRGHALTFLGALELDGRQPRGRRSVGQWRDHLASEGALSVSGEEPRLRLPGLYEASRRLRAGESVYITADGEVGREAFRVPLTGGHAIIRGGWLALRRATGATTLPVLVRREGRIRVVTIHPALPVPANDPVIDDTACARHLAPILQDYVRRFPAQCWSLALWGCQDAETAETCGAVGKGIVPDPSARASV